MGVPLGNVNYSGVPTRCESRQRPIPEPSALLLSLVDVANRDRAEQDRVGPSPLYIPRL